MTEWRYNMHACVNIECFLCVFFSILEVSYSSQTCVNCTFTEQRFYRVQSTTRLVLKSPKVFYPRTKAVVYQTYVFELNRSSLPSMYGTLLRFKSHLWINWQTIIIQLPSWFWKYICNKMHYFTKYRDEYHAIQQYSFYDALINTLLIETNYSRNFWMTVIVYKTTCKMEARRVYVLLDKEADL